MKKEFDLKIDGGTLESIQIDSLNSLIVATYKRDVAEFKAGDILIDAYDDYKPSAYISIFKEKSKIYDTGFSAFIFFEISSGKFRYPVENWDGIKNNRLATDEEKQLLFDALKKQGKRWNAERLEIEPEFKRGDVLASKSGGSVLIFDKYTSRHIFSSLINSHPRLSNNSWAAPAFRYASIEEIDVFYKYLARMGKKWNAEKLEVENIASKFPTKLEEIDRQYFITNRGKIMNAMHNQTQNNFTSKKSAEIVLSFIKALAFRDAIWAIEGEPESTDIDISFNFKTNDGAEHFDKMKKEIESGNL